MTKQISKSKAQNTDNFLGLAAAVWAQGVTLPDYSSVPGFKFKGAKLGEIVAAALPYVYALAGVALFAMLIWGGLEIMLSAGEQGKLKSGQARITNALVGFAIVFVSYFVVQIVEVIFSLKIV